MANTDGRTRSTTGAPRPNKTEVRRARRSWPATYKLEILEEIDAAERGQVGVILRREDLYSSLISEWRKSATRVRFAGWPTASPARQRPIRSVPNSPGYGRKTPSCVSRSRPRRS